MSDPIGRPNARLGIIDAAMMIVGIVVGAGIFRAPGLVAGGASDGPSLIALWALGGLISLCGALCYAELSTAFPDPGGEYHFLTRAWGRNVGFLFAWARLTVIPTGSIALLAFVFGDYAAEIVDIGPHGSVVYAGAAVLGLTGLNVLGLRFGTGLQNVLTALVLLGLTAMIALGLGASMDGPRVAATAPPAAGGAGIGLALVFVLLTYGGWNEAAYLSAEVRGGRRNIVAALVGGVAVVTVLYVLVNAAYLRVMGLEGLRASQTVGSDLMRAVSGPGSAAGVSALIALAALTSVNATVVMGSRTGYALGRDYRVFRPLGHWDPRANAPVPALLLQGALAMGLVAVGALTRRGFETMVEYTAPVFWAFFLLTGLSLFVLRARHPDASRPFRVPLYPLTPLVFCASCVWLLYSSIAYTKIGAAVGMGVLVLGVIPLWLERSRPRRLDAKVKVKEEGA